MAASATHASVAADVVGPGGLPSVPPDPALDASRRTHGSGSGRRSPSVCARRDTLARVEPPSRHLRMSLAKATNASPTPETLAGPLPRWSSRSCAAYRAAGACAPPEDARPRSSSWTRISTWRVRKVRSSSRFRRSQPVTSALHLLALHDRQAGTTLSSVYRPAHHEISARRSHVGGAGRRRRSTRTLPTWPVASSTARRSDREPDAACGASADGPPELRDFCLPPRRKPMAAGTRILGRRGPSSRAVSWSSWCVTAPRAGQATPPKHRFLVAYLPAPTTAPSARGDSWAARAPSNGGNGT